MPGAYSARLRLPLTNWGLRDYGVEGQLGLERTPEEYVARMVEVFREVRRVLRKDGTLWLNLGSSYMGGIPGQGGKSPKQVTNAGPFFSSGGNDPILSRRRRHAPACGTDGTALQDWTGADSACSDLCDECLADFLSHRDRSAGNGQSTPLCGPLPLPIGHDSERQDSCAASPGASLLDAQESTTLQSWLQRRGACSRCDSRASGLSVLRSSSLDAREFVRSSWLDYTTRLKQKDLVPIPWMVAMALQSDGWWLRQDIIWHKPNPMPESVTDRCTKAHEYLFLLTKSERYYYDADAIRQPDKGTDHWRSVTDGQRSLEPSGGLRGPHRGIRTPHGRNGGGANARSVWTIPTQPFPGAHFATMPEALVELCIAAGSAEGGLVLDPFCGSGTVGAVCASAGRSFVGIDLNPDYCEMARRRIEATAPLFMTSTTREEAPCKTTP